MAIQKFALYDLIVDIIPGAILLVVLYSIIPTGLYQGFFGIRPSLVPGVAVILLSYPFGRIVVHGISSKVETKLPSLSVMVKNRLRIMSMSASNETQDDNQNNAIESWFDDPATAPSDVSPSVVQEVRIGLLDITGTETNSEALRRYGGNTLFPRDTLYGKYEILSTFYRHMTFISITAFAIYLAYLPVKEYRLPFHLSEGGAAPISSWPVTSLVILLLTTFGAFILCLRRWKYWTESRNRAFINDLHTYLREKELVGRHKSKNGSPRINS